MAKRPKVVRSTFKTKEEVDLEQTREEERKHQLIQQKFVVERQQRQIAILDGIPAGSALAFPGNS